MIPHPVNPTTTHATSQANTSVSTQPVTAVVPTKDATQSNNPALTLGQKYLAQIGNRLTNGHFLVNVDDKWLQMRLPGSIKTGDLLELTLIEQTPRLKFLLHDRMLSVRSPATLSTAAKLITQLLSQSVIQPTRKTTPLLPAPPISGADKAHLSAQLQQTLISSGLFYEAHLAQWLHGKRTIKQLQQEPQGKLSDHFVATTSRNITTSTPVTSQLTALVQQQLHLLESGTIRLQGEIWPGQFMEWDIAEYLEEQDEPQDDINDTHKKRDRWQTQIRLELPRLGKIMATLKIDPQGIRIQLESHAEETTQQFKQKQAALLNATQAAGLTVCAMEIMQHET